MNRIKGLDGLRCLAAFAVVFTHLHSWDFFVAHGIERYQILIDGGTGVILFYVISGYLITSLAIGERKATGRFSILNFFGRRALRILPLYYLALTFYVLFYILHIHQLTLKSFLYAAFYIYNFIPISDYQGWVGSFHTLATEEHFYLVFPFLFVLLWRNQTWPFVLALLAYVIVVPDTKNSFDSYQATYFVDRWTIFACVPILVGSLAACVRTSWLYLLLREWVMTQRILRAIAAIALFAVFLWYFSSQVTRRDPTTMAIGFAFLLVFITEFNDTIVTRVLEFPVLVYLGKISYGLYVWQSFFLGTGDSSRIIPSRTVAFFVVIVVSIISYETFEKSFLKKKKRFRENQGVPPLTIGREVTP